MNNQSLFHKWFMRVKIVDQAFPTIICFPHGGGGAASFLAWQQLPIFASVYALRLPGREKRMNEPFALNLEFIQDEIIEALADIKGELILYGHSMGAGIAFELALELLNKQQKTNIKLLVVSGREPPLFGDPDPVEYLTDDELIKYIEKLQYVTHSLPTDSAFVKQYIPKIRADYRLNCCLPLRQPINLGIPISVINGLDDRFIRHDRIPKWQNYTSLPVSFHFLPGGHFFMNTDFHDFMELISLEVKKNAVWVPSTC